MVFRHFLIFSLLLFTTSVAYAREDTVLRVGVFSVNPIAFVDAEGNAQGLYPDLIREIVRDEGWEVTFVPGSLAECMQRLQEGQIDLIAPMAYTAERAEIYKFNKTPVIEVWAQVYVRPGSTITSFADLQGQKVGIVSAGVSGINFVKTAKALGVVSEVVGYSSFDEVFQAVANQEVVAGVAPQHYGTLHARELNLVPNTIKFSPMTLYFATLKGKDAAALEHIDHHLDQWKGNKNSYYYDRVAFWINGTAVPLRALPKWLIVGFIATILAVLFLTYLNRILRRNASLLTAESDSQSLARKKAEEELAARERLYRLTHFSIEHSHSAVVWLDTDGRFIDFNHKFCAYTGYTREELLGMAVAVICASCAEQFNQLESQARDNSSVQVEAELLCKDQTQVPVLIEATRFSFEGEDMLLAVVTDIARRKKAEQIQEQLEVELRQTHKMEAIGTLAGGIAHDFNNILTSMIGCTEMAIRRCGDDERLGKYLEVVRDGERRAAELVAQILTFARKDEGQIKQPQHLAEIVEEVMRLMRASIPSTVDINVTIATDRRRVMMNASQIHQVVMNLVTNAYQSLPDSRGILDIILDEEKVTAQQAGHHLKVLPGDYRVLSVIDSGCGMAADQLERVFDPYFTTKNLGEGTGFGLSIVQRIVQSHQGLVLVESAPGEGSTFKVYLPVFSDDAKQSINHNEVEQPMLGEQRLSANESTEVRALHEIENSRD